MFIPLSTRIAVVSFLDYSHQIQVRGWERKLYPSLFTKSTPERYVSRNDKKNILIYAINGLSHGGTEKNLQLIADSLAEDCNVFFMYGNEAESSNRKEVLDDRITFIPFSYTQNEVAVPHKLHDMQPHIKDVVREHAIELLITASPGYSHYPWNVITDIPIVLLNIFGAPTLQKNVKKIIYNSSTTKNHAEKWIGIDHRAEVRYAPLYTLPDDNVHELGRELRNKLHIPETDFVFGRIGRADDSIFDPIGIRAWQSIAHTYPNAHLVVMSPASALIKIVKTEYIPRVHFLPPSGQENDVWAFHAALDAFAHFRYDGETSGVAIAESITIGNPVISHRSRIWNAHVEYLNTDFARIADIDDVGAYASYMEEFMELASTNKAKWHQMRAKAKQVGTELFGPLSYREFIKTLVQNLHHRTDRQ